MEIIWYGQACFLLRSKQGIIVCDPYSEDIGLKLPKGLKANIVTISHEHSDHNNREAIVGVEENHPPFIVDGPGEYEIGQIEIEGIPTFHDSQKGNLRGKNTVYLFRVEDLTFVHLGDLGHVLSNEEIEALNQVDILAVPVGGNYTIDAKKAAEVVNQIDPKIVIPMHYKIDGLTDSIDIDTVEKFEREAGEGEGPYDVLKIGKNDLPKEERRIIILKPRAGK